MQGRMEFLVERWNAQISGGTPVAKAVLWAFRDAENRKRGEQTGLDTLVVHAVNGGYLVWGTFHVLRADANALSDPPGMYGRNGGTQRNYRGPSHAAEHAN